MRESPGEQVWIRLCRVCGAQHEHAQASCLQCRVTLPAAVSVYRVGAKISHKYQITALLGYGAMGVVYEAEHLLLKKKVALKYMHPALFSDEKILQRFHREALTTASIDHPNALRVIDLEMNHGAPILVTEFLQGQDIEKCLRQEESFPPERMVDLLSQALSALHSAHQRGIIHRDIKPNNLFVSQRNEREHVTVIDFGIAKILEPSPDLEGLTTRGTLIGTPAYMSPEQINNKEIDARADVWSIGVVLYQMLFGRLPFEGANQMGTVLAVLHNKPDFGMLEIEQGQRRALGELCQRALSQDRTKRPASAEAFRVELQSIIHNTQEAKPIGEQPRPTPKRSLMPLLTGMSVGAALFFFLWPSAKQEPTTPIQVIKPVVVESAPIAATAPQIPSSDEIKREEPVSAPVKEAPQKTKPAGASTKKSASVPAGQNKFTYAKSLVLARQFKDAAPLLEEVVKEGPNNSSAHRWLGDAYKALGKKSLAKQQWQKFLALSPSHPDARKVQADIDEL
jgi:serine/threonine protein kinase